MKIGTFKAILTACLLSLLGAQAQAADFNCFPASAVLKTTDEIKTLMNKSMPLVVRQGKNRKSTLMYVQSVSTSGCNISVKFKTKLERKKKAIRKKRTVYGHAVLEAEVGRFSGCLNEPKFTELEYAKTTRITEGLIRAIYNKRMPDSICPDSNGSISL